MTMAPLDPLAVPDRVRAAALDALSALDRAGRLLERCADHDGPGDAYRYDEVAVEVRVERSSTEESGDGVLRVRESPPCDGGVVLEVPGGPARPLQAVDGWHLLHEPPVGPVSLVLEVGGQRLRTSWSVLPQP